MKGNSSEKRGSEAGSSGNSHTQSTNGGGGKMHQMKLVGNYIIYSERLLGSGMYGKVYEAAEQSNTTKRYAVKVIPSQIFKQSTTNSQMLQTEIEVLKKLRHDNLVCLREISQSPNNLYLFLDFCNGGDLSQYIESKPQKKLSESEAIDFFKQFIAGYQHLYDKKIIHRDIKPENIMLHNGRVKLGDFGYGRFVDEGNMNKQQRMSIKCTPIYASPQLLKKELYSSKCDVWSSGCLLYKMLYGEYPFMAKDIIMLIKDIEMKVRGGKEYEFKAPVARETVVSEDVKSLLRQMFKYEECDRISWEEVFKHPVLKKSYNILGGVIGTEEVMTESDRSNPIFQSIMQNRNHVLDNDLISDTAQNFQFRNANNPNHMKAPGLGNLNALTNATADHDPAQDLSPMSVPQFGVANPSHKLPAYQPYNQVTKQSEPKEEMKWDNYQYQQIKPVSAPTTATNIGMNQASTPTPSNAPTSTTPKSNSYITPTATININTAANNYNNYQFGTSFQNTNYPSSTGTLPTAELAKLNLNQQPAFSSEKGTMIVDQSPVVNIGQTSSRNSIPKASTFSNGSHSAQSSISTTNTINSGQPAYTPTQTNPNSQQTFGDYTSETGGIPYYKLPDPIPKQNQSLPTQTFEEESYRNSLQKLQNQDLEQIKIGKVDKMVLFLRNQALFADVTMQLVFTARNKYALSSITFYELIYCLTGFYSVKLDLLRKQLNSSPQDIIKTMNVSEEDFILYQNSKAFKKTETKISKDSETANTFFKTLASGISKELNVTINQAQTSSQDLEAAKDFERFINLSSMNSHEYRNRFNVVAKKALVQLQPERFETDLNSLRGIRGIQIFMKLDEFMPVHQYLTFDFRFFYDQFMNKVETAQLLQDIRIHSI